MDHIFDRSHLPSKRVKDIQEGYEGYELFRHRNGERLSLPAGVAEGARSLEKPWCRPVKCSTRFGVTVT
jgi:hypothetical protein